MCGIFGSVGVTPDRARIDIVAHRGPDGDGWQVYDSAAGPVALGHRRLAIIDVSDAGLQPMADASGRFHLVFNGEIYNYLELREEMRARGEVFTSDSDSEVLLRGYMLWGEEVLSRLRGMFAFLIWDAKEQVLFAARDRYGIKPLYLVSGPRHAAFGSEIKQLLGLPGVSGRMNVPRVHDFLANGISDHTDETMFEGVRQLRGGECATLRPESGGVKLTIRRWYAVGRGALTIGEAEAGERFRALLDDAVRLHLRSDVPLGSCLSGGLDSSSLVCLMAGMLPAGEQVNTISACYAEKQVDEKPFMDVVVAHAGTKPHFIFPKPEEVFAKARQITWHQDEPFGSTSIFAQWCVFEEAHRVGVKVMLDGQGADEQLAGYHFAFPYHLAGQIRRGQMAAVWQTLRERQALHGLSMLSQIKQALVPLLPPGLAAPLRRRREAMTRQDWLGSALLAREGNPDGPVQVAGAALGLDAPVDVASLSVMMTFASNLQMLLHWEDRNSMAHAIEARVPFLDHPLVEFSLALGNDHKIVGGDTKRVLRRAMSGILPQPVLERRDKLGFATPEEAWFRGPLRGLVEDGVAATLARYPDLVNGAGANALASDMLEGRRPVDMSLWRLVNLGIWGETFGVTL